MSFPCLFFQHPYVAPSHSGACLQYRLPFVWFYSGTDDPPSPSCLHNLNCNRCVRPQISQLNVYRHEYHLCHGLECSMVLPSTIQ
jgi:hypothetical protein